MSRKKQPEVLVAKEKRSTVQDRKALASQYAAFATIVASLAALTLMGPGNVMATTVIAFVACIVGVFQKDARFSWSVVLAWLVLCILGFVSNYIHLGTLLYGYVPLLFSCIPLYMLSRCLDQKLSHLLLGVFAIWCGIVAVYAIGAFVIESADGRTFRLSALNIGTNVLGIFFAMGWFGALSYQMQITRSCAGNDIPFAQALKVCSGDTCQSEACESTTDSRFYKGISYAVAVCMPLLLSAMALTLSVGSFIALFFGVIFLVVYLHHVDKGSLKDYMQLGASWVSQIVLGVAPGAFLFVAASSGSLPIVALDIIFLIAFCLVWPIVLRAVSSAYKMSYVVCALVPVAGAALAFLRPNAFATFAERIEMMGSGISYMGDSPLTGIGSYAWRRMDASDGGTFFNSTYIHNGFIHFGVEIGILAMIVLVVLATLCFVKRTKLAQQGAKFAFLVHILFDVSLFSPSAIAALICTSVTVDDKSQSNDVFVSRVMFGGLALSYLALAIGAIV